MISLSGSAAPSVLGDFLFIDLGVSDDAGGSFSYATANPSFDGMADGAASVNVTTQIPLVAGTTYVFAPIFQSQGDVSLTIATCHGVVTITRQ